MSVGNFAPSYGNFNKLRVDTAEHQFMAAQSPAKSPISEANLEANLGPLLEHFQLAVGAENRLGSHGITSEKVQGWVGKTNAALQTIGTEFVGDNSAGQALLAGLKKEAIDTATAPTASRMKSALKPV